MKGTLWLHRRGKRQEKGERESGKCRNALSPQYQWGKNEDIRKAKYKDMYTSATDFVAWRDAKDDNDGHLAVLATATMTDSDDQATPETYIYIYRC